MTTTPDVPLRRPARRFETTRWSLVLEARGTRTPQGRMALEDLCRAYWKPVYSFVVAQTGRHHDAQDLTQSFFASLLDQDSLDSVHPDKGRFRSFLLAAVRHFLSNERDRSRAAKRGGGRPLVSLEQLQEDPSSDASLMIDETPEALYERRWALALLDRVMVQLAAEYAASGRERLFAVLSSRLTGHETEELMTASAEALSMSVNNVRVALHRLRHRYRAVLRREVAQTTDSPEAVDDEIRHLFRVLQGPPRTSR